MNRAFSIYLDIVRFTAAFLVYVYHSNNRLLVKDILPASNYGHSSVIVFFVLSGFVIAYVTATKESNFPAYAASRISRVFVVTIPAILLTLVLDSIGRELYPKLYASYPWDQFIPRIAGATLLANEVWTVSITFFSNVPYWSICYEWWYYVGFAMLVFLPARTGIWAAVGLFLLLGPKIALLAPIWALGVLLFHWKRLERISLQAAWVVAIVSIAGLVAYHAAEVGEILSEWLKSRIGEDAHKHLTFSKFFLGDYLLGVLVFANFVAMRRILHDMPLGLAAVERPVRYVAGFTFTLYLLHQPLFLFWGAVLRGDPGGYGTWFAITALMMASVMVVGHFTENRRYQVRKALHASFSSLFQRRELARSANND